MRDLLPDLRITRLPRGVGLVKKSGKYQGRVYDSLDTKKQRGIGCFSTPEQAGAAVDAAEAALKQGISPWAGPTRVNKHKRGETPVPAAKKPLVPSVVVQQRECKTLNLKSVPLPATREEVYNACVPAFLEEPRH